MPQAAFMINCLHRIQNVLTLFEFTDARIEMLDSQVRTHVQRLNEAQMQHYALRSGLAQAFETLSRWQAQPEEGRRSLLEMDALAEDVR
jgi:hypothetical protein